MDFDDPHLTMQLGQVPHFQGLPPAELQTIVAAGHVRRFSGGEALFQQGAPCAGLFVLLAGEVQVRVLSEQGHEHALAIFEPVRMFNEVAVLDGGPNVASAVATRDTVVWHIATQNFSAVLERHPRLALGLIRVLAGRNRQLVLRHADVTFRSVLARTADTLLQVRQGGRAIDRGVHDNADLAARIATVPEVVSRCLKLLQQRGLITCTRAHLQIVDVDGLVRVGLGADAPVDLPGPD